MENLKDKVAVITGAASGIGRAVADRCVDEGLKVVLADVEHEPLRQTQTELQDRGGDVLAVQTDVAQIKSVEALAQKTCDYFGAVHLLFNNAGVAGGGRLWESSLKDWEWVMGVNLWGVIYGIKTFVPLMLEQNTSCHIVNTASVAGLISGPGMGIYKVTKHSVVTLSETLYHELALQESKINVSVLCPGFVKTQILDSGRNRPEGLQNEPVVRELNPAEEERRQLFRKAIEEGMSPEQIAHVVFKAIREETFYILPHPEFKDHVKTRLEDILEDRNPTTRELDLE